MKHIFLSVLGMSFVLTAMNAQAANEFSYKSKDAFGRYVRVTQPRVKDARGETYPIFSDINWPDLKICARVIGGTEDDYIGIGTLNEKTELPKIVFYDGKTDTVGYMRGTGKIVMTGLVCLYKKPQARIYAGSIRKSGSTVVLDHPKAVHDGKVMPILSWDTWWPVHTADNVCFIMGFKRGKEIGLKRWDETVENPLTMSLNIKKNNYGVYEYNYLRITPDSKDDQAHSIISSLICEDYRE